VLSGTHSGPGEADRGRRNEVEAATGRKLTWRQPSRASRARRWSLSEDAGGTGAGSSRAQRRVTEGRARRSGGLREGKGPDDERGKMGTRSSNGLLHCAGHVHEFKWARRWRAAAGGVFLKLVGRRLGARRGNAGAPRVAGPQRGLPHGRETDDGGGRGRGQFYFILTICCLTRT